MSRMAQFRAPLLSRPDQQITDEVSPERAEHPARAQDQMLRVRIGDRSFSSEPDEVAEAAVAYVRGLQQAGVAASGKHFPGHGDTASDSHYELPRLTHSLERLSAVELPPFQAAVEAGVASIMTAHVLFEALDKEHPATLSQPVIPPQLEPSGWMNDRRDCAKANSNS